MKTNCRHRYKLLDSLNCSRKKKQYVTMDQKCKDKKDNKMEGIRGYVNRTMLGTNDFDTSFTDTHFT